MSEQQLEVLVIGAGPVGISAGLQLGRAGVKTLVVERRSDLSRHPKAMGVHPRTMEMLRGWDLAERLRAISLPLERTGGFGWMTRLNNGIHLGEIDFADEMERLIRYSRDSPEQHCFISQILVEPVLFEGLREQTDVSVQFDTTAQVLDQDQDGVTVAITRDGVEATLRAKYVIAADGTRSPTRESLGITETAAPAFGETLSVYFKSSDMEQYMSKRPYLLWWVVNARVRGTFWPVDLEQRTYMLGLPGDPAQPDAYYDEDYCASMVRAGVGDPDLEFEILEIARWQHQEAVADSWQQGRVFLAGDAAHRFPPHGGFGMNSGIQDTGNLCWKLQAVLRGWASESLLESYEAERKPVAEANAAQSILNTVKMKETGWLIADPAAFENIEEPEGEDMRRRISESVPEQREMLWSQGQQLGYVYDSSAVVGDGTKAEQSTISEYVPTGHPGARAPHLWLTKADGTRLSTLDLLVERFTVLCGVDGQAWVDAAEAVAAHRDLPISAYIVGDELAVEDGSFTSSYGIDPGGAVVVRPDGHVMMRSRSKPADCESALEAAFTSGLALDQAGVGPR